MTMIDIKLKPLFSDICALEIGDYLASSAFERECIKYKLDTLWQYALESYQSDAGLLSSIYATPSEISTGAFKMWIQKTYNYSLNDFSYIINVVLNGFIESFDTIRSFDNVFEDLALIQFPKEKLAILQQKHNARQADLQVKLKKIQADAPNDSLDIVQFIEQPSSLLVSQKNVWYDMLSKADIQSVIHDLQKYASNAYNHDLLKKIINLSSRWHRTKDKEKLGIIPATELNIEINKINDFLIDLISELK